MTCASSAKLAAPPALLARHVPDRRLLDLRLPRVIDPAELAEHAHVQDPYISPPKVAPQDLPRGLLVQILEALYFPAVGSSFTKWNIP